ncbi:flagellar hook-associated protein FlgK [Nocardioides caldifontis]|uniref:flagellar hook-associated protein FlgK n=1 Tax=Nocardioides caldifontis TaxID=2588938 RepID=UPI0011E01D83|nr:flagellar hook-associated protein FlgK [Nocardioides caldifontis]
MSFSSINTALSALRYNQAALDTASNNIANVGTEGYTRRRVEATSAGTPTTTAMWSRNQHPGGGVRVTGVTRMTDPFLDARVRTEHGKQSYLDTRQAILDRLETGIGEPGENGLSAVMAEFRQGWADLANNPSSDAARSQVLARGASLADAVQIQARNFTTEAGDQRARVNVLVAEVNTIASDLAATNKAIQVAQLDGSDAGNLLDQRDLLALRLSELTGGTTKANGTGGLDVAVNGVNLVTGGIAGKFEVASGVTPTGEADGNPVTFRVVHPVEGTSDVGDGVGGELGAVRDVLDVTIPGYLASLGQVAKGLADAVNALHQGGYDAAGNPGAPFFTYDPADPAGSLAVAITDPAAVAASSVGGGAVEGSVADALAEMTSPETAYQQLVNGFGTQVASSRRLADSQMMLTQQVDGARDQLAGVSLDEEMLSMVEYQRGYEAAARVLTTIDSILDTLINRTGLTR